MFGNRGPEALRVEILHYGPEWLKRFSEEADIGHELSADVVHLPKEIGLIEDCYATCEAFIRFRNGQRAELKLMDVCNCAVNDIRMIEGFHVQFDAVRLEPNTSGLVCFYGFLDLLTALIFF